MKLLSTIVAAIVKDNDAIIAHVGDSRIYLLNDEIKQLTKDHSIVQTLIENGEISLDDAKHHPRKNVITRALGVEAEVVADFDELTLNTNDTLLLCTDGLTNYVPEANIYEIFKQNDLSLVSETLVAKANENGGGDNITVVTLTAE